MMRSSSRWACTVIGVLAASVISGCNDESLGKQIAPSPGFGFLTALLWAADSSEVYYLYEGVVGLEAAKSDGSGTRVLDDTKAAYYELFMPPDGSSLYYTATETAAQNADPQRPVYEAFQGRQIDGLLPDWPMGGIAASPDDRHIAHLSNSGLQYFDLTDASSVQLASDMAPAATMAPFTNVESTARTLAFSPAGDEIFFLAADDSGAFTGGIVDPASQAIVSKSGLTGAQPVANWSDGGLQVLWIDAMGAFQIEDVASEQFTPFWPPPQSPGFVGSSFGGLSRDGAKIAVWDSSCTNESAATGASAALCFGLHHDLDVVTIATGVGTRVLHDASPGQGPVAFSPDGKRVAYSAGAAGLYVLDVP
jgi:hypothetical protein